MADRPVSSNMIRFGLTATLFLGLLGTASVVQGDAATAQLRASAFVRVNQVGYITSEPKQAVVLSTGDESGARFTVDSVPGSMVLYSGVVGSALGPWNGSYQHTYLLDFSSLTTPGTYTIDLQGRVPAQSPRFRVDSAAQIYAPLLANASFFYRAQHDGALVDSRVLHRAPSHLTDRQAFIYSPPTYVDDVLKGTLHRIGGPIDVSGGWFDAGDYLKFVATASYVDAVLLYLSRQYPSMLQGTAAPLASEGAYGLDWLQKMWDEEHSTLYYQVGFGNGNGNTLLGEYDFWQLPQASDQMQVKPGDPDYFVKYRTVFQAGPPGSRISPNLAGRLTADFGLCYQLFHRTRPGYAARCLRSAETIFDLANTLYPGQLLTISPHDGYPETSWRDDMELGATELYLAIREGALPAGLPHTDPQYYLRQAAQWAHAYISGPDDGTDTLNLYDMSGLAHVELYDALQHAAHTSTLAVDRQSLLSDLLKQVKSGVLQGRADPFGLGIAYGGGDATPHAFGLAIEASLYDQLAGTQTYATFERQERDWLFGRNAWGTSFVVGAGTTFPYCMQHQVANLSGSLNGAAPILLGAITDGPSAVDNFKGLGGQDGMRKCPANGGDPFAAFTGKGARYWDNAVAWPSVEPADDYVVLSPLLYARLLSAE